jgi:segregation and condensation protein A
VLDWTVLRSFLPEGMETPLQRRAALAATFAATLELARDGKIELRQEGVFGHIYLRRTTRHETAPPAELQQQ